jgi:L-fuconolactonase
MIVDPDIPIIDPHHHLWPDGVSGRFMLDDLLSDLGSGHNVEATVYIECGSFYRSQGPEALRPVGEVEFARSVAELGATGLYGRTRFCTSIVGFADLRLGSAVDGVLDGGVAAGDGRLKEIRHIAANEPEADRCGRPGAHQKGRAA